MPRSTRVRCDSDHITRLIVVFLAALVPALPALAAGGGSGFFLGGGGRLVTAAHVVAGCAAITVVPEGQPALPAEIATADAALDLAILRVAGAAFPEPALAGEVVAGGALTALGYPGAAGGGGLRTLPLTAIALPIPRPPNRMPLRGAVAAPGMSGAPVLDAQGRIAGMLLGRGDPAAPGAAELARKIGFAVEEIAIAVPAHWLGERGPAAASGAVTVARVLCAGG